VGREGPPAEDEKRIEDEVQGDRSRDDQQRHPRLADAAHQRLEHGIEEDEDDADEGDAHEAERAAVDIGGHTQQLQQIGRQQIACRAQEDGGDGHHHHGLGRDMIDHVLAPRPHILRRERRSPWRDRRRGRSPGR
jgi:hypothetical protein